MSNCSFVNENKSGPANGWYCDKVSDYVDSSLYKNYCNGSVSCKYCPHLGGDDRYRKGSSSDSDSGGSGSSGGSSGSGSSGGSSERDSSGGGSSGGGSYGGGSGSYSGGSGGSGVADKVFSAIGGVEDRIFKFVMMLVFGVVVVCLVIYGLRYLGAHLGLIKSQVRITVPVTEDNSPRVEDISIVYISQNGTGKEFKASFNAEGISDIELKKGDYMVYEKYDGMSIGYTFFSVSGLEDYSAEFNTDLLDRYMYCLTFCDESGNELMPEKVSLSDSKGNQWAAVKLDESTYICPMLDLEDVQVLYVKADQYEVRVAPQTDERIMKCKIMLK